MDAVKDRYATKTDARNFPARRLAMCTDTGRKTHSVAGISLKACQSSISNAPTAPNAPPIVPATTNLSNEARVCLIWVLTGVGSLRRGSLKV